MIAIAFQYGCSRGVGAGRCHLDESLGDDRKRMFRVLFLLVFARKDDLSVDDRVFDGG